MCNYRLFEKNCPILASCDTTRDLIGIWMSTILPFFPLWFYPFWLQEGKPSHSKTLNHTPTGGHHLYYYILGNCQHGDFIQFYFFQGFLWYEMIWQNNETAQILIPDLWNNPGKFMKQIYKIFIKQAWQIYEMILADLWNRSGKLMKRAWQSYEMVLAKLWNGPGNFVKWVWQINEIVLAKL
jgi:hypothetical protein